MPVTSFTVTVGPLAGDIFDVTMGEKQNSVKQLKLLIQQEQGTPRFSQTLFLLSESGKTEEASEFPMTDEKLLEGSCSVVLCVQTLPAIKWAKYGSGISFSDNEKLIIEKTMSHTDHSENHLATGSVTIGGEDGVRQGYFEVELAADASHGIMICMIGIVKTGFDHDKTHHFSTDAWYLYANNGQPLGQRQERRRQTGQTQSR